MKKVLSLVLAFAMILGSFGFVFASNFPDVKDGEYFTEPVNVLAGLDVIAGFPDGTFGPEKEVTRAQMATMIVNALGMTVTGKADTKFSDVSASHWASGFINYAASVGFIAGYPDGTFKPDQQVTYDQALTMIVAAEGYKSDSLTGTWPGNFVNQARALGILDICKTTGNANAPRQDIACFLYKALTNKLGYTDKDGAFHPNLDGEGVANDTMLSRLGAGKYNNGDPFVVKGTEDSVIGLQNYLGEYVTAYANKDGEIIAIAEELSTFIEGDVDSSDLMDTYNFDTAKKVSYVSFTNGDLDATAKDYKDQAGVKLAVKISGKTIKEVYSMQVWEAKDTFFAEEDVQEVLEDSQKLDTYAFALDDNEEIEASAYILEGADSLEDIKEDDVVTVYLHTSGKYNGKIAKIQVSDDAVEGTVTKINTKGTVFTIGGEKYGINEFAEADGTVTEAKLRDLMEKETSATFYLDYDGNIFDFEAESGTKDYAIVLGKDSSTKFGETSYELKLFLADGTSKVFSAKEDFADAATGKLVEYTINDDNVVTKVTKADDASATPKKFSSKGVYADATLTADTVVFTYAGSNPEKASSYSVADAKGLFDATFTAMSYVSASGNFKAVVVTGASNLDVKYAIITGQNGSNKDGKVYTALYDGEVKDFTFKDLTVADSNIYTTGTAVKLAKLTFNGSGFVTEAVYSAPANVASATLGSTRGSASGGVYTDSAKNKFTLEDDVKIFVKTADGWELGSESSLKGGDTAFVGIWLVDTDSTADGEYNIVLVVQK